MVENIYYVDMQGLSMVYFKGGRDMTVVYKGDIFHHENGFMLLGIL